MSQIKNLCRSLLGCFWDFWMFWQTSALSSGPGKQILYFLVQPALFPQVACDLITGQASINLWPGQHIAAACQLDVCTSYKALCLSIWTFYTEMGTSRLYPVNWKVLSKLICCLTCRLDFTVRAKTPSWVSEIRPQKTHCSTPVGQHCCLQLRGKQTFQYFLDNQMFIVTQFD